MEKLIFRDLGVMDYKEAWDLQQSLMESLIQRKKQNRTEEEQERNPVPQQHYLLFVEHPHVYTLGKSGKQDHLLFDEEQLRERQISFYKINRGGDITYHGPGQIVGYPIFDLDCLFTDVHRYVRYLEEVIILTLAEYGLKGERREGYTGVWLAGSHVLPERKICAIGVHLSRWVTMHGFAFNVDPDLSFFNGIVPCGIRENDKAVTSLSVELGRVVDKAGVMEKLKKHFVTLFGFELVEENIPF